MGRAALGAGCLSGICPSQVDIQTEAPGFAPQQVEELVTKPIENAVSGAAGLATLRSESIPGCRS